MQDCCLFANTDPLVADEFMTVQIIWCLATGTNKILTTIERDRKRHIHRGILFL